jgi:hypothetical protein
MSASREIDRLITIARQSTAVRGNLDVAKAFIDAIAADPMAEIPDLGEPNVEHLEPRIEKPMPDGSQYINRGIDVSNETLLPITPELNNPALDPTAAHRAFCGR